MTRRALAALLTAVAAVLGLGVASATTPAQAAPPFGATVLIGTGGITWTDVSEEATPDDGLLDVYSLEVRHWWRLLMLLPWLRRGTQRQWRDVRAFRTTALSLRTRRPRPVNTDGELTTHSPAEFRLRPAALRVFAPPREERPG